MGTGANGSCVRLPLDVRACQQHHVIGTPAFADLRLHALIASVSCLESALSYSCPSLCTLSEKEEEWPGGLELVKSTALAGGMDLVPSPHSRWLTTSSSRGIQ